MTAVEKDKEYISDICAVSSDGNGICRIEGYTVFVPYTVTGDTVKFVAEKIKRGYGIGRLIEIIKPSPYRKNVQCNAYQRCGGCQFMHIDYEYQLEIKREIIDNAMQRIGGFNDFHVNEVEGMENPTRYRNKMIFHVGNDAVTGFYSGKSHDVIHVDDCVVGGKFNSGILETVREYMLHNNITSYNEKTGKGLVRGIFTRVSYATGDLMVVICVNGKRLPKHEELVSLLTQRVKNIKSIIINVNLKKTNLVLGNENITVYGDDTITDTINGVEFSISPQSFFQVNPIMTEKLYAKALEYAKLSKREYVMDIYCGIGTISLSAARMAKKVVGVEIVEEAIADAKKNALNNHIDNVQFYASPAEKIVPKLIEKGEKPNVVILDPPRKGSDEKTLTAIVQAQPERIVYISCNPATLARDARFLSDKGYKITASSGYDMFPQTCHVECVCLLTGTEK